MAGPSIGWTSTMPFFMARSVRMFICLDLQVSLTPTLLLMFVESRRLSTTLSRRLELVHHHIGSWFSVKNLDSFHYFLVV
ncbi:unnamed protein product [Prunus armeniaca]